MTEQEQLHDILHGEPDKPRKKKAGKPVIPLADTFDGAMAALKPLQSAFVRHVLAGSTAMEAYGKTHPGTALQTHRNLGSRWASRKDIGHAIALAKKQGALAAISGIKFDLTAAHDELCSHIAKASKQKGGMNAVAQLMKLKMTLHKLDQPQSTQQQGVQIILQTADGVTVRSFGGVPTDSATDIEGETVE